MKAIYPDDVFVRVVGNSNALNLPVLLHRHQGNRSIEAQALLDSGATSNFINYRLIQKYQIRTVPLKQEMIVHNADETENILGHVKEKAYSEKQNRYNVWYFCSICNIVL